MTSQSIRVQLLTLEAINPETCEEWMDSLERMIAFFHSSVIFGTMSSEQEFHPLPISSDHPSHKAQRALNRLREIPVFCLYNRLPV